MNQRQFTYVSERAATRGEINSEMNYLTGETSDRQSQRVGADPTSAFDNHLKEAEHSQIRRHVELFAKK